MDIVDLTKGIEADIIRLRREFHAFPEPGNEERETSARIKSSLRSFGVEDVRSVAGTGVVADLRRDEKLPTIAFRADMDALPIREATGVPYASRNSGLMHACGHDAHMAMVLGAARLIAAHRDRLKKNVRFIFQPCEETPPGGATRMIEGGCLDCVGEIYGFHVDSSLPAGTIAARVGPAMAAADRMRVTLTGAGGHAARPHETSDLVFTAARALAALEALPCRRINPAEPSVLSFCSIHAGNAYNIIPEKLELQGTIRTISDETCTRIKELIDEILEGVCKPAGAKFSVGFFDRYPVTVNDAEAVGRVGEVVRALFGDEPGLVEAELKMGAEDFSFYAQRVRGAFINLGTAGAEAGSHEPHHSPRFNVEESALWKGTAVLVALAFAD